MATPVRRTGDYVSVSDRVQAFVPYPLPPEPPINLGASEMPVLQEQAHLALGELRGIDHIVPDVNPFIAMCVRREAVLSSRIEGTRTTLPDLLGYEAVGPEVWQGLLFSDGEERAPVPKDDIREVANYIRAMEHGLQRLHQLPLSPRLLREVHEELLAGVRGHNRQRGQFRTGQVHIGDPPVFVPPPPHEVPECMARLGDFLHADVQLPVLVKAALIHCQFEMIHPFWDGNGRIGRLLITLYLCQQGTLERPILSISSFFNRNAAEYRDRLLAVSVDGDWEGWVAFFLRSVSTVAGETTRTAVQVADLRRAHLESAGQMPGRQAVALLENLYHHPVVTIRELQDHLHVGKTAANALFRQFEDAGILVECTGKQRNRRYLYRDYVALFTEGTEPI